MISYIGIWGLLIGNVNTPIVQPAGIVHVANGLLGAVHVDIGNGGFVSFSAQNQSKRPSETASGTGDQ